VNRRACLIIICLVPIALHCATTGVNRGDINLFSSADEVRIGRDFADVIEKEMTLIDDPEVIEYIDMLGQMIVNSSERRDISYMFKVVDSDEVNAFALPGGFIYVNKGLILEASNEGELVSVIAHEVGHVVARHGTEQLTRQYGFSVVTSLVLGSNPEFWEEQAAGLFSAVGLLSYGRKAELEADRLGIEEMFRSGYNPSAMVTFFEKLLALHEDSPSSIEKLFRTHPPTQERIDKSRGIIGYLPFRPGEKLDSERFHDVKAILQS